MIVSKMIINSVAGALTKHFKLDKIMSYVFDDNELDKKVKNLEIRIKTLEVIAHPPRDFIICQECKRKIKQGE